MPSQPVGDFTSQTPLTTLYELVQLARSDVEAARARPSSRHASAVTAQRELLAALEHYVTALMAAGRPVPYRLRDELHLYRRLDLSG